MPLIMLAPIIFHTLHVKMLLVCYFGISQNMVSLGIDMLNIYGQIAQSHLAGSAQSSINMSNQIKE